MRVVLSLICVVGLAACSPGPERKAPEPTPAPQPSIEAPLPAREPVDAFQLGIEAGRWQVLIDHAASGAMMAPDPVAQPETDAYSIDRSLKVSASSLLTLRDIVCAKGLLSADKCTFKDWPAWASEAPTAATPLETLQQRSDWLGAAMSDVVDAGCKAGKAKTKDELFCSVE